MLSLICRCKVDNSRKLLIQKTSTILLNPILAPTQPHRALQILQRYGGLKRTPKWYWGEPPFLGAPLGSRNERTTLAGAATRVALSLLGTISLGAGLIYFAV